jgi:NAD(P)-dependent dehydrogenase (short-subunit alcohol dehydrogenase family)
MNAESGTEVAKKLGAIFHKVNVTDYQALGAVFKSAFTSNQRLDFVFANAGVMERGNFYEKHQTGDEPPPPPNMLPIDINTTAMINTSYLAQHYFRQTPNDGSGPRSLVITASCGGLYAVPASCIYGASKFGALGFARNIAGPFWQNDGIRVNVRSDLPPSFIRLDAKTNV